MVGLFASAVWAAEGQPSDTQFDLATFFSSLGAAAHEGTISSAFKPTPVTEPSTQQAFGVWATTVESDEETLQALINELVLACEQTQATGSDFQFTTAICPTPDVVDAIFGQPDPPVVVVAESEQGWDLGQSFQLTIVGTDLSRPVYAGSEGDPNDGHNTGYDLYWNGEQPALGLTTHNKTGFEFVPFERGIVLIKNPGWIGYLLPGSVLGELEEPEVWINDGGWDQAPVPVDWGGLYLGSPDFVAESITGGAQTEEEPEAEPQPEEEQEAEQQAEEEAEPEPQPEEESEPEAQEQASEEPASESDGQGLPVAVVAGGGAAVAAAVGAGVWAATRRRKSKCEELLEDYDRAHAAWAEASRTMNQARDAYALGETAGTEEARIAQEAAEQAEQEAYNAERRAWDAYTACTGEARAARRAPPARSETAAAGAVGGETADAGVIVSESAVETAPDEVATAPPPVKPEPCQENAIKDVKEIDSLRGSLTLAFTISPGTEGIRSTEGEAAELVNDLNDVGDQISEINDAIQDGGSGTGALVADAAATVLELTARLGAGAAAAASQMLEGHRVYNFTYEEHRVVVDMRWKKLLRCIDGSWECFYDLEVRDFHEITIPQTESFEGNRDARNRRMKPFIRKGETAVARDRPRLESFLSAHNVGPC